MLPEIFVCLINFIRWCRNSREFIHISEEAAHLKRSFYVFSIVVCLLITVTIGTSWAATETSDFDVSGTWHYSGTGTINTQNAEDIGTITIRTTGDIGSQTITGLAVSGTLTNTDNNRSSSYSYSEDGLSVTFSGDFRTTYNNNSLTITFTETSDNTATMTQKGTISDEDGNNYYINLTYQATRGTSSSGGSGGGCNIGFDPVSLLLFLPLLFVMKKQ